MVGGADAYPMPEDVPVMRIVCFIASGSENDQAKVDEKGLAYMCIMVLDSLRLM